MKIITCASYTATGSSAVTDFFSEFDNCYSVGNHEIRFIFDPNGIRDLEYNLIENFDRHKSAHAIKKYLQYAKYLNGDNFLMKGYKLFTENDFMQYTNEYINNITELKTEAWWSYDIIERGRNFAYLNGLIHRITRAITRGNGATLPMLWHEKAYFSSIDKDTFYKYTKEYVYKVMESLNKTNAEYLMVDQLLPPMSIQPYFNYFDDNIKVIISDRDPRDLYLLEKEIYKCGIIPSKSVEDFCNWYRIIRKPCKSEKYDKDKVCKIQFEDWIYRYEETKAQVISFVGIDPKLHVVPKSKLNPDVSIKNTNLKKKYPKYARDIQYIEANLEEYLYKFPDCDN